VGESCFFFSVIITMPILKIVEVEVKLNDYYKKRGCSK
jgi:hypothetical protein